MLSPPQLKHQFANHLQVGSFNSANDETPLLVELPSAHSGSSSDESSSSSSSSSTNAHDELPIKKVGFWSFVFVGYFCACGGPYGMEVGIQAGYPLFTMIFFLVIPWFWSLPLAMLTAELSTSMPSNDAFVLWIKTAWGPLWGFTIAWVDWFACVVDNTLYPVLFINYLSALVHSDLLGPGFIADLIQIGVVGFVMAINLMGVDIVGHFSFLFTIFIISPFFVLLVWSGVAGKLSPSDWITAPETYGEGIVVALNVAIWSYSGYDSVGAISEELVDTTKNFTKAMVAIIASSIGTYTIAFISSVGIDTNYSQWKDGYFTVVAHEIGGKGMGTFMGVAALVSALGTFNALLCSSAQSFKAIAKKDLMNVKFLRWKHPRFRTPWAPIMINCTVIAILGTVLDFTGLLYLNNAIYATLLMLQYATLIKLRYSHADMPRPFKIGSNFVTTKISQIIGIKESSLENGFAIAMCIPPLIICLYILGTSARYAWLQVVGVVCMYISGISVFSVISYFRRRRQRLRIEMGLEPESSSSTESESSSDE